MKKNFLKKLATAREAAAKGGNFKKTKPIIGSREFFIENDPSRGISTKESFGEYLESLNEEEFRETDLFFNHLSQNKRLDFGRGLRFDKFGKSYYWVTIQTGRISQGLKLVAFDGLEKLIETNGQYDFDLTLDSLCDQLEELAED